MERSLNELGIPVRDDGSLAMCRVNRKWYWSLHPNYQHQLRAQDRRKAVVGVTTAMFNSVAK